MNSAARRADLLAGPAGSVRGATVSAKSVEPDAVSLVRNDATDSAASRGQRPARSATVAGGNDATMASIVSAARARKERMQSYAFSSYACPIRDIPRRAACARRLVAIFILERKSKAKTIPTNPPLQRH